MSLTEDAKDIMKSVELMSALSSIILMTLLLCVEFSHPSEEIRNLVQNFMTEVLVGVVIGVTTSIILFVAGTMDTFRRES